MIVVGVDGSQGGLVAVSWAMREAGLRGVKVRIVHVVPGWAYELPDDAPYAYVGRWMRQSAASVLADALRQARDERRGGEVESELLRGDPRLSLIRASKDADLLVVGSHGLGGFGGLLLGSVALGVSGQATCPVAVIRRMRTQPRNEVVVGVDGSPGGAAVIEFAFAEAGLRGADLRAIHAWSESAAGGRPEGTPARIDQAGAERHLLAQALTGQSERHPEVRHVEHGERGHPVEVLLRVSAGAGLLVVGSRGRSDVAGLLLGSVSHSLLHHAACPLVVIAVADSA
ncbi:Nucleotide-binding universal stress protein, UspA family [Streptosporangium canum]|uniref:Nucleotide-binding universal stress protein, UspA family n=1 Tax=Streptosporangium canum TaxID=324952 RepID=A0A1I3UY23_9ACTN|nr:universal stress protein [Streptosporangium canum]SFJ88284.1 Nucleotide-binding universal stress protein, UspA family [Streptosporangium canum]